ncbi:distal tubule morphoproteinsis [Sparganum proliferum]
MPDDFARSFRTINQLRTSEKLCDVVLTADDVHVPAHKLILAAHSPYFKAMFTSGLAETRADNVRLEGISGQALSSVVHFIYTNELPDCTDLLLGLLPVADFLRLRRLVNLLCALLARRLDVKNCLQIMRAAKICNCNDLWHNSKLFAQRTFPEVVDRNAVFSQLSLLDLEDLIRSDSTLGGEETIFQAILKWSEEKEGLSDAEVDTALSHVRYAWISPDCITNASKLLAVAKYQGPLRSFIERALAFHSGQPVSPTPAYNSGFERPRQSEDVLVVFGGKDETGRLLKTTEQYYFCETTGSINSVPSGSSQSALDIVPEGSQISDSLSGVSCGRFEDGSLPDLPTGCYGCQVTFMDGLIYLLGGHDGRHTLRTTHIYDTRTEVWGRGPPMSSARYQHGIATFEGRIYALGGHSGSGVLATVECLRAGASAWSRVKNMHSKRWYTSATVFERKICVVGGCNQSALQTVETFDPRTGEWKNLPDMNFPRLGPLVAALDHRLFAVGGLECCTVEILDSGAPENGWTRVADMHRERFGGSLCVHANSLFAIGGLRSEATVERYDPERDRWILLPDQTKTCRWSFGATLIPRKLLSLCFVKGNMPE